jgi:tripartite-type tricarboxylate transporter receptor subunit TctC
MPRVRRVEKNWAEPPAPDRPIRLIVSIAAGSVTDVIMRAANRTG